MAHAKETLEQADKNERMAEMNLKRFKMLDGVAQIGKHLNALLG